MKNLIFSITLPFLSVAIAAAQGASSPSKSSKAPRRLTATVHIGKANPMPPNPEVERRLAQVRSLVEQGEQRLDQGDARGALGKFQEARKITTLGGVGLRGMADALYALGDPQGAANARSPISTGPQVMRPTRWF
jgi:hypothetical protein